MRWQEAGRSTPPPQSQRLPQSTLNAAPIGAIAVTERQDVGVGSKLSGGLTRVASAPSSLLAASHTASAASRATLQVVPSKPSANLATYHNLPILDGTRHRSAHKGTTVSKLLDAVAAAESQLYLRAQLVARQHRQHASTRSTAAVVTRRSSHAVDATSSSREHAFALGAGNARHYLAQRNFRRWRRACADERARLAASSRGRRSCYHAHVVVPHLVKLGTRLFERRRYARAWAAWRAFLSSRSLQKQSSAAICHLEELLHRLPLTARGAPPLHATVAAGCPSRTPRSGVWHRVRVGQAWTRWISHRERCTANGLQSSWLRQQRGWQRWMIATRNHQHRALRHALVAYALPRVLRGRLEHAWSRWASLAGHCIPRLRTRNLHRQLTRARLRRGWLALVASMRGGSMGLAPEELLHDRQYDHVRVRSADMHLHMHRQTHPTQSVLPPPSRAAPVLANALLRGLTTGIPSMRRNESEGRHST